MACRFRMDALRSDSRQVAARDDLEQPACDLRVVRIFPTSERFPRVCVLTTCDAFVQEKPERVQINFRVVRQVADLRIDRGGGTPQRGPAFVRNFTMSSRHWVFGGVGEPDRPHWGPMEIWREFRFEAAHLLPNLPDGHKCKRLHGHSYRVRVFVGGEPDSKLGWVIDFADISEACEPIRRRLDHYYLNEIEGLENPTSEALARWIWRHLQPTLPILSKVEVSETCTSGCAYRGD